MTTTTKSVCDCLDGHFLAKAAGQSGDSAFDQLLTALGINSKPEVDRCKTVLQLMQVAKKRGSLRAQVESLEKGDELREKREAVNDLIQQLSSLEAELMNASLANAREFREAYPERARNLRRLLSDAKSDLATAENELAALKTELFAADQAFTSLSENRFLPLHVRSAQSNPNADYHALNTKRMALQSLISQGEAAHRALGSSFDMNTPPPWDSIDSFAEKTGSDVRTAQLWNSPERYGEDSYTVASAELFATFRDHVTLTLPVLKQELSVVINELSKADQYIEATSSYYQDRI